MEHIDKLRNRAINGVESSYIAFIMLLPIFQQRGVREGNGRAKGRNLR